MPAPPSDLVTALRTGTAQRHIFFSMTHSQGTVRVWDGIGDFAFDGATYLGRPGVMEISGVSDSGDIQNHELTVTLNGVSLAALLETDTNIRGEIATITAVWLTKAGAVTASRVVSIATGDVLKVKMDRAQKQLIAKLRGPLAEWRAPPRAYYTDADQQRRYAGDDGFRMVKQLENASVSGWSKDPESSGSVPRLAGFGGAIDSLVGTPIGAHTWGLALYAFAGSPMYVKTSPGTISYKEETSEALATASSNDFTIQVGGVNAYVDISGDVRSAGGLRIAADADATTNRLRKQGTIAGNGTATATRIVSVAKDIGTGNLAIKEGGSITGNDRTALVYCNQNGAQTEVSGTSVITNGVTCVEETTLAAVAFVGGFLQVGGSDCFVSTTGVILTPGNRRVVKSGGTASEFLRVWT
jgi:cytoskeletal protein CcmA (bactofilin family)